MVNKNNFFRFFEEYDQNLLNDFEFIYSWNQILEEIELGQIISKVKQRPDWHKNVKTFETNDIQEINDCLDSYFDVACRIIASMNELQKDQLLIIIDKKIANALPHARLLVNSTLYLFRY